MFAEASSETVSETNSLFDRNMAAFEQLFPHVHERLAAVGRPHSSLVVRPDGGIDMMFGGTYFYDTDAVAFAEKQLTDFFDNPVRRFFDEPDPAMLRGITGEFCCDLRSELDAHGIDIGEVKDRSSYYTIVFGVGLGFHIDHVVEATDCRLLVLVEPSIENLFHSLSVVEWSELFERANMQAREIAFVVDDEVDAILLQVRNSIRDRNPALIDGVYLYTHYNSSVLQRVCESFNDDLMLLIVGLGYLEDEFKMTANAASNIARRRVRVLADPLPARQEPLLIAGSGPSIDKDLDKLVSLADRAAVMTVGTGLRVLLDHGVRPDFHVEVENGIENAKFIEVVRDEFGLDGITLVGSITLHPSVRELFTDSMLFFRERSSATMLFGEGRGVIQPSGPTVANAALSSAVRMGFREIYFFGLDMGSKIGGRYHSAHSVYGVGHFEEPIKEAHMVMPGNFGGEASAENVLFWSRYMLESFLRLHPQIDCYNCSDGVRVVGATPKVSRVVNFDHAPVARPDLVDFIVAKLPSIDRGWQDRCWDKDAQLADAKDAERRLREVIARARKEPDQGLGWMDEVVKIVRFDVGESPAVLSYFFGTFVLMLGVFWWYQKRMATPEARKLCRDVALQLLDAALDYSEQVVLLLLNEVDGVLKRDIDLIEIQADGEPLINRVHCALGGDSLR